MKRILWLQGILLTAIVLLASCDTKLRSASILIHELLPPTPNNHNIFIAVNGSESDFNNTFITNGITIAPGGPFTNLRIDNIFFESYENDSNSRNFWLMVAEDTDNSGNFNDGDRYLPFARITLTDGETLEIHCIDFTMPFNILVVDVIKYTVSILHSNPAAVDKNHKITLSINAAPACYFSDTLLCKEMIFWITDTNPSATATWDKDGNNSINIGDYRESQTLDRNKKTTFVLSPLNIITP